jgi:serine/threonine protein kinase
LRVLRVASICAVPTAFAYASIPSRGGAVDGYKTTWGTVSDAAKALVRSLLTVQPAQRASAATVLSGEWLSSVCTPRGGWIGKMRERSTSGWRAGAKPDGKGGTVEQPRLDRGQIDRGEPSKPTAPVNTDAKMGTAHRPAAERTPTRFCTLAR